MSILEPVMSLRRAGILVLATVVVAVPARAEVARVEVKSRAPVGGTGYEKIVGTAHFAVLPRDIHNRVIVDLDKAPRNSAGRVEFSADFYILRPTAGGNGAVLLDVLNRGGKPALTGFNRGGMNDPATDADLGDGFLLRHGFTVAWVGWETDIPSGPGLMRLTAPVATAAGKPIAGVVRAVFTPSARSPEFVVTDLMDYDAADPDGPDSQLSVRPQFLSRGEVVPRGRWHVRGHTVTIDDGFEPGRTYEVTYRATNPVVAGLGLAATRDFATWLKHDPHSLATAQYAYAFGSSQSGRFLREFLYDGFNTDERDRPVFDGVMAHIAGAARIDLNARWATPRGLGVHSATAFPFADASLVDAVSGQHEGLLDNKRAHGPAPKVFYTNTPVEYWGTGRAAALVHTSPDGKTDLPLPENVRLYFFAGTQHAPARFPPGVNAGQLRDNPVDYWWSMRALLLAMHRWVSQGVEPPPSAHPTLRDRTLVPAHALVFPAIPGVSPGALAALTAGARVANPLLPGGAGAGTPLPLLVPSVDEDGNDQAGIRMPDVSIPLGTFTGWNFRNASTGASGDLVSLLGSFIPFAPTRDARAAAHDPRRSIEERYDSRESYLSQVRQAADALVRRGYLLPDDVDRISQRASGMWDLVAARTTVRLPESHR
ncbi:MAG TPA: alpha/beta hydrolase domain-containing protein [Vicinamibacterales bacterium]|jgi:hypothetical protein|nr:alpha/beta hydrolase domain-containing protein [Vicinamibacterales bacterium]